VDIIQFYNYLQGGPINPPLPPDTVATNLNDRHRFKITTDLDGNTRLSNSQVGMTGDSAPIISDGWHDVWYTSWVGADGLYHKRVWFDGGLVYNDVLPFAGEATYNERRWGFNSAPYMGEWHLDYFGIYDEGAVFLPPVLRCTLAGRTMTLSWDFGTLQQVDHLPAASDDWTDVDGATSPYPITLPTSNTKQFFRLRY
jgi:hypothetical protein